MKKLFEYPQYISPSGMVAALDESLQNITVALSSKGLLENSVIIFTTTAGGAVGGMELNMGSNFPLRGSKMTVWEGGIRGVSFVYSEKIHENCKYTFLSLQSLDLSILLNKNREIILDRLTSHIH